MTRQPAHVIRTLDELGVEHGRCRQYEGENGCARVTLTNGDRVFLGSNKGGVAKEKPLDLTGEDLEYIKGFSIIHTSNNSHFDSQLAKSSRPRAYRCPMTFPGNGPMRRGLPGLPHMHPTYSYPVVRLHQKRHAVSAGICMSRVAG